MSRPTCITSGPLLCTGSSCRTAKGFKKLAALVAAAPRAHEVPCQDVCSGPVVGLAIDGDVRWFEKVRGSTRRAAVAEMVRSGRVPGALAGREVRKRRGTVRGARRTHPLDQRRVAELRR